MPGFAILSGDTWLIIVGSHWSNLRGMHKVSYMARSPFYAPLHLSWFPLPHLLVSHSSILTGIIIKYLSTHK